MSDNSNSSSAASESGNGNHGGLYGLSSSLQHAAHTAGSMSTSHDAAVCASGAFDTSEGSPNSSSGTGISDRKHSHSGSSSGISGNNSSSNSNSNNNVSTRLTAKPHAFAGAVLSPKHTLELTPTLCLQISSALADHKSVVPYTVWITEAWRVLGWAEPSAALFWEMATLYHALAAAGRELAYHAGQLTIPPILSCGSTSSLGSGATNSHTADTSQRNALDKKKMSSVASAKELPVWLVGTFLLLHCEELAYLRNLSGQAGIGPAGAALESKLEFPGSKNPGLSPRTRLHATWNNDTTHCTAFLLRHLRKILLLSAVSHNHDATVACLHLASMPSSDTDGTSWNRLRSSGTKKYNANELRRQHADEHGSVGAQVRLTMEDLDRLDLVLHPPHGGGMDEPPLRLGDFVWRCLYHDPPPPTASIPLVDVEREIRQQLELELAVVAGMEDPHDDAAGQSVAVGKYQTGGAPGRATESHKERDGTGQEGGSEDRVKNDKERRYNHIQGTTVILKPLPTESPSTASVASGEANFSGVALGRLHDVVLSDCSDTHFYLLQPFEHATIAACSSCTIVVGAVAGLLHIVDCEKLVVTTASRRILVSNSSDVQLCMFTPSPPLLVGDNRSCLFAPYNTFYDGMREDLLATGLAAAVISDGHPSSYNHRTDNDATWPPLQCASNKWKQPIEVAKLEVPTVPGSPSGLNSPASLSPGADDRAMGTNTADATLQVSALVSPSDFQVLFVPIESDASRQRRLEADDADVSGDGSTTGTGNGGPMESQYCQLLAEVLQLSPFRLPLEFERRALVKAERMKNIQQAVQKSLSPDQQHRFEEELNRGFRDWMVTSGNLRQVLDLVHLEVKRDQ